MNRLFAVLVGVLAPAVLLAAPAGASVRTASGDTCTATGSGTEYTLHITLPGGVEQYGFAFGAPGTSITNAVIPGSNGNFSTTNLAPNTSGAWISDAALPQASVVTVTTTGATEGAFTIVPAAQSQSSYFDAIKCAVSSTAPARAIAFTVATNATYSASAHGWRLVVTIPTAGTVSAAQPEPTVGTSAPNDVTKKALVQVRRTGLAKSGGNVTLTLKPTAEGQSALAQMGSLKLKLRVTFDSQGGKASNKTVSLTLRK